MKERTKEELLTLINSMKNTDRLYGREFVIEIIDQLVAEIEKPKVWDGAPEWAVTTWQAFSDGKGRGETGPATTRALPKTRAREIAEEVSAMWQRCDPSFSGMSHADTIEAAILRREKELEEGRRGLPVNKK